MKTLAKKIKEFDDVEKCEIELIHESLKHLRAERDSSIGDAIDFRFANVKGLLACAEAALQSEVYDSRDIQSVLWTALRQIEEIKALHVVALAERRG